MLNKSTSINTVRHPVGRDSAINNIGELSRTISATRHVRLGGLNHPTVFSTPNTLSNYVVKGSAREDERHSGARENIFSPPLGRKF